MYARYFVVIFIMQAGHVVLKVAQIYRKLLDGGYEPVLLFRGLGIGHEVFEAALRCPKACIVAVDTDELAQATALHNWSKAFCDRACTLLVRDVFTLDFTELQPKLPDGQLAQRPAYIVCNDPLWDRRHAFSLESDGFKALILKDWASDEVYTSVVRAHRRRNGGQLPWTGISQAGGVGGTF